MSDVKHPFQPVVIDEDGTSRFRQNAIVRYLINTHPSANHTLLADMPFSDDDRRQFAQLIGYSLDRFAELAGYVSDDDVELAEIMTLGFNEHDARIVQRARVWLYTKLTARPAAS